MNTATIVVLLVVIVAIIFAAIGSFRNFHEEKCCGGDKNCTAGVTKHCSIRKERDD